MGFEMNPRYTFILREIAFGLHIEESTSTEIDYKQEEKEKMQTIRNFWNHKRYVDTFASKP